MKREQVLSFAMGSMVALAMVAVKTRAADPADYGDANFAQVSSPEVQEIPGSLSDTPETAPVSSTLSDIPEIKDDYRPESEKDANLKFAENPDDKKPVSGVSTARETFGVSTLDNSSRIYVAPFLGFGSVMGNETANASPRHAVGVTAGYLVSDRLLVEGGYTYNEQNFSGSKLNSGTVFTGDTNMFALKNNIFRAGGRFYVMGRDSQWRPYAGGGLSWSKGYFNYTDAYLFAYGNSSAQFYNQMEISQFGGYGELGLEYAISKQFVVSGSFKISGPISGSTTGQEQLTATQFDPQKLSVGNSLARAASYQMGISVGMYF